MPPVKRCQRQVLPWQKMPNATFSQPYVTICAYEKDQLIPKLCMTINLSKFINLFIINLSKLVVASFAMQNLLSTSFAWAKHVRRYVLTGGMIFNFSEFIHRLTIFSTNQEPIVKDGKSWIYNSEELLKNWKYC